jgi:hypothetical protein
VYVNSFRRIVRALCLAAATAAIPGTAHTQSSARHAWFTTVGEVRAADDGWVELQFASADPLPPHHPRYDSHGAGTARFSPTRVQKWVAVARRELGDSALRLGGPEGPELRSGSATLSFAPEPHSSGTRFLIYTRGCRSGLTDGATRAEVILLVDALSNAARVATSMRSVPRDRGLERFSRPEVTCPAHVERAAMPAWPAALGPRPAARGEALAHFLVTEDGRVDLSTLTWDRRPPALAATRARAALAQWRYEPAESEGRHVRQWTHATIWFADSSDADERLLARWARTASFVARADGRVAHSPFSTQSDSLWLLDEAPLFREAYPPTAVRTWLAALTSADTTWRTLTVAGGVTRRDESAQRAWYQGCAVDGMLGTRGITVDGREAQLDSIRTVLAQAERIGLRAVDSTRVHGETEVTCPARLRERLARALTRSSGTGEVVLSFVVTRAGRADPGSMLVMGTAPSADVAAARRALEALEWEPGRLSGVAVPQRAHLVLYPAARQSMEFETNACAQASLAAVRLHVRESNGRVTGTELTGVAHAISHELGRQARPPATDGRFAVTFDDSGRGHFFSWIRPPSDSAGGSVVPWALGATPFFVSVGLGDRIAWSIPAAPLALEVELARTCP